MNIATAYLQSAIKRFEEYKSLGDQSFAQLDEAALHLQPNPSSNSIAIIIQHLHGNMLSRWTNFLTEDGEKAWRNRDAEFEVSGLSKTALLETWEEGWQVLFSALHSLNEEDLLRNIHIRHQPLMAIDAINRQLAHYSYHVGQIVLLAKWVRGEDWQTLSIARGASQAYDASLLPPKQQTP